MPVWSEFSLVRGEDAVVTISLVPPQPIDGWSILFEVGKRFGWTSGLVRKSAASGYGGGQSGITVTDSGGGQMNVAINGTDTSGLQPGTYCFSAARTLSGQNTTFTQGELVLMPR